MTSSTLPIPSVPARRLRRAAAFTLIEVLATLVMIGIVLPVAMHGVSLALAAAGSARSNAEAISLADAKLSELAATSQFFPGDLSGDFSPDHPEYTWRATTTAIDLGLEQITVRVTWTSRGSERFLDVSTWVYRPSSMTTTTGS